MSSEPKPSSVLAYDGYTAARDRRARWIVPGFCLGAMLTGLLYALIGFFVVAEGEAKVSRWIDGVWLPIILALVLLLPSIISLGLVMWIKQRLVKEVRFARFRMAVLAGFVTGLYPLAFMGYFLKPEGLMVIIIFVGALIWFVAAPAVAGLFLCYRWHLRN